MWRFFFDVVIGVWLDWVIRNVPARLRCAGCLLVIAVPIGLLIWALAT